MKCPHGKLGTGFPDRLCGNDTDGLANIDLMAMAQVPAVAFSADTVLGLTCQCGPNQDSL